MNPLQHPLPHGGNIESIARQWACDPTDILDLSTGLHPAGQPLWLGKWLQEHASWAASYPDIHGEPARQAVADEFSVPVEHVCIVAGAQAVIEVIFQAMQWSSIAIQVPCYSEPIRCARRAGCDVLSFVEDEAVPNADALWWTSPHNPSGQQHPMPAAKQGVLDESYMAFSERRSLGVLPNIIRLGSLTKTFAIPGLRLGYVIAESRRIQQLKAWLPPWPTATFALHLLPRLLSEADMRDASITTARQRLTTLLKAHQWQCQPSQASFVLAKPPQQMPDFDRHHILVRSFPEWPQLHGWVRLGLPHTDADWLRLERSLCPSP